jgi:hypothetical protein
MKELKGEEIRAMPTPELIKYKQELDRYKQEMLEYIYGFAAELRNVKLELRDRAQDLEIELLCTEGDRLDEESSVSYTPDNIH